MKLHTVPGSPNGRTVEAVIHHLGLDVEIEFHDLFNGDLRAPRFLALNPNGMVPVLVDGSFVLWESAAIMQYLADKAEDQSLFPRDAQARADITRWQCWAAAHFNKAFGALSFETVARPRFDIGPPNQEVVRQAQEELKRFAPVLDTCVAERQYLVGQTLTLADYSMLPFESYRPLVPFDWTGYANINTYFDRLRTAEAWVRSGEPNAAALARAAKAA
jgi:glutathione S-transferase